ncbi:MAG: M57 family metalloprotease [Clostridium sp.]|jgi:hypothetical protein|nr:M57 family metalloprotease [Clostridium sp.]
MKKFMIALLVVSMFVVNDSTACATSYLGTGDNVDSGGHLDWDYNTTYYSQTVWGMNLWNHYKSGVIREDSLSVIQDLFVTDINSATAGYYGYRDKDNATIYFNIYGMSSLSANAKKSVAAHELGHALGLGHNPSNTNAVMTGAAYFPTVLVQDDKDSYDAAAALY